MHKSCQNPCCQTVIDPEELEAHLDSIRRNHQEALINLCSDQEKDQMIALIDLGKIQEFLNYLVDVKYKFDLKSS